MDAFKKPLGPRAELYGQSRRGKFWSNRLIGPQHDMETGTRRISVCPDRPEFSWAARNKSSI